MSNTMKASISKVETFIFMTHGNMVEVIMDFDKRICTVYSAEGRVLLRIERMTLIRMNDLRNKINRYVASKKKNPYHIYHGAGVA